VVIHRLPHRPTGPTSAPFRVRAYAHVRPVMRDGQRRCWSNVPISCCLSATGVRFLGHPFPAGGLGLPCGRLTDPRGPDPIGIPRSTRMSCDRGGCPLDPGDGGALPADCSSPTATRRLPPPSPYPPGPASISGGCF